jgi:hypothetical protein
LPISLPGVSSWSGFDWAYYLVQRSVTADRVQPHTFYLYYNGVYKTTNGGKSWHQVSGSVAPFAFNSSIQSVPGKAGNLFFTSGIQEGGTNPPAWAGFYNSSDGGKTWTAIPNVLEVIAFGFGAPATGETHPTLYIVGYVNNVYGVWQSASLAKGWSQIGTIPIGELDQITAISGDPDTGNVYVGFAGGGYAYLPAVAVGGAARGCGDAAGEDQPLAGGGSETPCARAQGCCHRPRKPLAGLMHYTIVHRPIRGSASLRPSGWDEADAAASNHSAGAWANAGGVFDTVSDTVWKVAGLRGRGGTAGSNGAGVFKGDCRGCRCGSASAAGGARIGQLGVWLFLHATCGRATEHSKLRLLGWRGEITGV